MCAEDRLPISVVIPTLCRPAPFGRCLASLTACKPQAAEIVVADQSGSPEVADVAARFADVGSRLIPCSGCGVSRSRNVGLKAAANEIVLVTDDD
jgi:glycosyltransferase involved in cell wall biosynthesis